jgi:hypothetical protein
MSRVSMMEMEKDNAFLVGKVAQMELELQKMKEDRKKMVRKLRLREVEEKKKMLLVVVVAVNVLLAASVLALFAVANSK